MRKTARICGNKRKPASREGSVVDVEELMSWDQHTFDKFRCSLLAWYDANHRVLPWRRNAHSKLDPDAQQGGADPNVPQQQFIYWVWVCEVMSQQTQIERVREYWTRWIAKWPTVADLAEASEEDVNQMWAGLGYYRRARYLLDGARAVRDAFGGVCPTTTAELQRIPGVGAYTGNAIASIACGEPVAVMDANVIRVVSRLFCIEGDPQQKETLNKLNAVAQRLLDRTRPGDFNQAMMELGAVTCLGNGGEPKCDACPINNHCGALQELRKYQAAGGHKDDAAAPAVTRFPAKAAKKEKREAHVAVCVVELHPPQASASSTPGDPQLLLVKRPDEGLLAGLWEFPSVPVEEACTAADSRQLVDKYLRDMLQLPLEGGSNAQVAGGDPPASITQPYWRVRHRKRKGQPLVHVFSHIRLTMHVEHLVVEGVLPQASAVPLAASDVGDVNSNSSTGKENVQIEASRHSAEAADPKTAGVLLVTSGGVQLQWLPLAKLRSGDFKLTGAPAKVLQQIAPGADAVSRSDSVSRARSSKSDRLRKDEAPITTFFKPSGKQQD